MNFDGIKDRKFRLNRTYAPQIVGNADLRSLRITAFLLKEEYSQDVDKVC